MRLSDIEGRFSTACGKRGADVRPDFHWKHKPLLQDTADPYWLQHQLWTA
jgi:hypothetical protein